MADKRLFGVIMALLLAACTGGETEDVQVHDLPHACDLLDRLDTAAVMGFATERLQRTEENNEEYDVKISQCDHYGSDMSQRFSLVVRQDFSNRKLKSGQEQLTELRDKLGEFAEDGVDWQNIPDLGEAAAWNGTANQLTIYEDKGHTTLAFSVYGTGDNEEKAKDLAYAALLETPFAPQAAESTDD